MNGAARKVASQPSVKSRPWSFLALTLAANWLVQLAAVIAQPALPRALVLPLAYAGSLAPLLVTVALLFTVHDSATRRDFIRRLTDPSRIGARWWAAALLLPPALSAVAALFDRLQGARG